MGVIGDTMLTYSRPLDSPRMLHEEDAAAVRASRAIGDWMLALDAIQEAPDSLSMHSVTIRNLVVAGSREAQVLFKSVRTLRPGLSLTREEEQLVASLKLHTRTMVEHSSGLQDALLQYMTKCGANMSKFEALFPDSPYTLELKAWLQSGH